MIALVDVFGVPPVAGEDTLVRNVGWITKEAQRDAAAWRSDPDPGIQLYVQRNPRYDKDYGLTVLIPCRDDAQQSLRGHGQAILQHHPSWHALCILSSAQGINATLVILTGLRPPRCAAVIAQVRGSMRDGERRLQEIRSHWTQSRARVVSHTVLLQAKTLATYGASPSVQVLREGADDGLRNASSGCGKCRWAWVCVFPDGVD
jgi:hypothetical protein